MPPSRATLIFALSLSTGCRHPLEDFHSGAGDSALDDAAVADVSLDAAEDAETAPERDSGPDDTGDDAGGGGDVISDMGPPPPEGCTTVLPGYTDMVCIDEGVSGFDLGAVNPTACSPSGCPSEQPTVNVKVSQFWIDPHEVTVGRFRNWWNSSPRSWPSTTTSIFVTGTKDVKWRAGWPSGPTAPATSAGCAWISSTATENDDKPLNCVDWFTALAFCLSEGKRLPSEAEWELVASGGQNRLMPWSAPGTEGSDIAMSELDCAHVIRAPSCTPLTVSPSSTVWGRTKTGVWNMAGSLAEWVADAPLANWSTIAPDSRDPITDPGTSSNRIARGASWLTSVDSPRDLRAAGRPTNADASLKTNTTSADLRIGFRCAKR